MTVPNLTREDAAARRELLKVENYRIVLDLTDGSGKPGEHTFRSTTTVAFDAVPGAETVIDVVAARLRRVTLNGRAVDVGAYDELTGIALHGLAEHNVVEIDADCRYSNTGEGLHRFVDPVDDEVYLYSQFQTADAKRVFACFDQPDLKATFDVTVAAPEHWRVISNSPAIEAGNGVHTFATTPPMSTYLVAVVAGPYAAWADVYRDEHTEIPLGLYCRASLAESMDAERLFTETKQGFGFYHKHFGMPYAFGKYDQLFVPEFNAGAMENAGAVTFLEASVFRGRVTREAYERRAETVLHEMAHMWFGDLVTMYWWDDLWLNESFATFAAVWCQSEATEYTQTWVAFAHALKAWAYRQDQLPSTHPVAADIEDLAAVTINFDGITYAKGAAVLKQLVAYVGLEQFLAGLRDYFRAHAFGNAGFDDLLAALEKTSGRDLSDWGRQWLKTTGVNTLRADVETDDNEIFTRFTVSQSGASPGAGETRVHRVAIGIYDDDENGRLTRIHREEVDIDGASTDVPALVGVSRGKLVLVNDDDLTYCSLRLDEYSLAVARERIGDIADPLARCLVWSTLWDMTRDAELKARDFVALVSDSVHAETEVGVVQRLLVQAQTALTYYADPDWAHSQGWPAFADRLLELARGAEPGSDYQLAFLTALAGSTLSDRHTHMLAALLDSDPADQGLPGVDVDTDLRWQIVTALAKSGSVDADEAATPFIDAQARRDQTAVGAQQATIAATARPHQAVKEHAWEQIITDDTLANTALRSLIAGFSQPDQSTLLAPFTKRYFDAVAEVWQQRSTGTAQTIAVGLYPAWDISDDGLANADEFLAAQEHPPALRRVILEGRSGVERSLRARKFDVQ